MSEPTLKDNRRVGWFWAYNRVLDDFAGKIDVYAFSVYMALCRHAMNRGKVQCSLRFIAATLSISLSTASGAINALEEVGLLGVEKSAKGVAQTYVLLDMIDDDRCSPSSTTSNGTVRVAVQTCSSGSTDLFAERTANNEVKTKTKYKPSLEHLERVYELYPRKVAKRAALKAIEKAWLRLMAGEYSAAKKPNEGFVLSYLQTRVIAFALSRKGEDEHFTPFPATWFNGSRYLDNFGDSRVSSETSDAEEASDAVVSVVDKVRRQLRGAQ